MDMPMPSLAPVLVLVLVLVRMTMTTRRVFAPMLLIAFRSVDHQNVSRTDRVPLNPLRPQFPARQPQARQPPPQLALVDPAIDQRAQRHVAADTGKTVEIRDPARAFGGTYGITVRQTLALRLIAAAHPTLPPVELNRIPSPSFRAGAHFTYDYIIN